MRVIPILINWLIELVEWQRFTPAPAMAPIIVDPIRPEGLPSLSQDSLSWHGQCIDRQRQNQ